MCGLSAGWLNGYVSGKRSIAVVKYRDLIVTTPNVLVSGSEFAGDLVLNITDPGAAHDIAIEDNVFHGCAEGNGKGFKN
jgi:hypothetical protein